MLLTLLHTHKKSVRDSLLKKKVTYMLICKNTIPKHYVQLTAHRYLNSPRMRVLLQIKFLFSYVYGVGGVHNTQHIIF